MLGPALTLAGALALGGVAVCAPPVPLDGRPCPCAQELGYECCAATGVCARPPLDPACSIVHATDAPDGSLGGPAPMPEDSSFEAPTAEAASSTDGAGPHAPPDGPALDARPDASTPDAQVDAIAWEAGPDAALSDGSVDAQASDASTDADASGLPLTYATIDFPGAYDTVAAGINDLGEIVGWYDFASTAQAPQWHGFLLSSGRFTTLDHPNATLTQPTSINKHGDIAGQAFIGQTVTVTGQLAGFLLSHGAYTDIVPPGADGAYANGVDDNALVIGTYQLTIGGMGASGSYRWQNGAFVSNTVSDAGSFGAFPMGISSNGSFVAADPGPIVFSNESPTPVRSPCPGLFQTHGINNRGQFVGTCCSANGACGDFIGSSGDCQTYLYDGAAFRLLAVPSGNQSIPFVANNRDALGINNAGQIVGNYAGREGRAHGFLAK
jgi:hypothetical protein